MTTILVPTDFSDAARNASVYALHLASAMHYKIILYHAYHMPVVPTADAPMPVFVDQEELEKENMKLVIEEAAFLQTLLPVPIDCITTEGFAVDEILRLEETKKPEFIVMGLSEAGRVSEFLLGSIATDVMAKTHTPVIIVPEKTPYKKLSRIAFASDYAVEPDTDELNLLKHLIKMFNAKLYIINVEKEVEDIEVDKAIQMMKIENDFDDVEHSHHLPVDNDLIHGINEFVADKEIDMIAMIPHKHNLLSRMFKESNTKKMAFHTSIPLLTLHSSHRSDD